MYRALRAGERPSLPPVQPYRDYIGWLQRQDREKAQTYWQQRLAGLTGPTPLGIDTRETPAQRGAAEYRRVLAVVELSQLEEFAQRHQVTVNTLALAAWGLLLSA